jgi:hypothetical protein
MANIYLSDGGVSRWAWANPYEQGFTTNWNSTTKKWDTITKTGYTTTVAAGDFLIVALATTSGNVWWGEQICQVQSVTSSTIKFSPISGVNFNQGATYLNAWITKPIIDIADTRNYYSTLYSVVACSCPVAYAPGTSYPYALNSATDTLILQKIDVSGAAGLIGSAYWPIPTTILTKGLVTLYNSGTWNVSLVAVSISDNSYYTCLYGLSGGTYTIPLTLNTLAIQGGTYTNTVSVTNKSNITSGTFLNTVTLTAQISAYTPPPTISGGNFIGNVVRVNSTFSNGIVGNVITGGTYSPTATCAISNGTLVTANLPTDPGFKNGGGTFSPVITLSGSRNSILAAGFP